MPSVCSSQKTYIGVVDDVDLGAALSDADLKFILRSWGEYPVLVFPGQKLDSDQQQAFAEMFGPLIGRTRPKEARGKNAQENPYMMLVSNVLDDDDGKPVGAGDYPLDFHSDGCFRDVPALATFLYGIEIPAEGGETLFVDMSEIYEALTPRTRARILGLSGVNYHRFNYTNYDAGKHGGRPAREVVANAVHPMVISHPVSKKPVVFANRHNTFEIVGLEKSESDEILQEIFSTIETPRYIHRHVWKVGDLVMWDNRAVQHARAWCAPEQRRMLRRFAVEGSERLKPYQQ
jgi:taurine dioxygenase